MTTTTSSTSGITTTSTSSTSTTSTSANALDNVDFNTYITLLTVQLKHQDPMEPMDSSQFTSEIATYAGLEQQMKTNTLLEDIAAQSDYSLQTLAASYLGKEIMAEGNGITFDGTNAIDFGYRINEDDAQTATLTIVDNSTGKIVRTSNLDKTEGVHAVTWDGTDDDGNKVGAGNYTIMIEAVDEEGSVVSANAMVYSKATELITEDGEIYLKTENGDVVDFADVQTVRAAQS